MSADIEAAYLDWPVSITDNHVWCANPACPRCPGDESFGITSRYGLTPRRLCMEIAAHARGGYAEGQP